MRSVQAPNPWLNIEDFKLESFRLWPLALVRTTGSGITLSGETYILVSAATAVTLGLPAASINMGTLYLIKKLMGVTNTLIVSTAGADKIDGSGALSWTGQYETRELVCDGLSNWYIF